MRWPLVTCAFNQPPGVAGRLDCRGIVPVEDDDRPFIPRGVGDRRSVDEEPDLGTVGIFFLVCQVDRLPEAVTLRRVRQEGFVGVGPKIGIEGGNALGRSRLDHRRPAPRQGLLQQPRQHRFEILPLQVVEEDLRHRP